MPGRHPHLIMMDNISLFIPVNTKVNGIYAVIKIILIFFFMMGLTDLSAQEISKLEKPGSVSFITSQNIYVRFENTDGISIDDTLYVDVKGILKPAIIVKFISTTSCSGIAINNYQLKVGDQVKTFVKPAETAKPVPQKNV